MNKYIFYKMYKSTRRHNSNDQDLFGILQYTWAVYPVRTGFVFWYMYFNLISLCSFVFIPIFNFEFMCDKPLLCVGYKTINVLPI